MTADGDFLSRWSRRKQAAAEPEKSPPPPKQDDQAAAGQSVGEIYEPADVAFDITKLPPIDSITAISDVRDFLRVGVPADLTRAALRRAWSADPAIRDFIGLAENAWDFTDPNAMPGFGPLEATDNVRRMVEQIISRIGEAPPSPAEPVTDQTRQTADSPQVPASSAVTTHGENSDGSRASGISAEEDGEGDLVASGKEVPQVDIAMQYERGNSQTELAQEEKILRRTHGGALPH